MAAIARNNAQTMLYFIVIVAVLTSQFLSVAAIRCHQCNSHKEEDCITLRLSTPRAQRDDQFLKECETVNNTQAFCRKTVLKIEVTGEKRIIRECGWIRDKLPEGNDKTCFSADNEGFTQMICACDEDGCNGSQTVAISKWSVIGVSVLSVVAAAVLRRN